MGVIAIGVLIIAFWVLVASCLGDWSWLWFGAKCTAIVMGLILFSVALEEWRRRWAFMNSRIASKVLREVK